MMQITDAYKSKIIPDMYLFYFKKNNSKYFGLYSKYKNGSFIEKPFRKSFYVQAKNQKIDVELKKAWKMTKDNRYINKIVSAHNLILIEKSL